MPRRSNAVLGPDYVELAPLSDHKNLAETVYQHLLAAISGLKIKPGEPLNEVRLAQHLGVSVTPVREALLRLSADGLVVREPQRQPRVVLLSSKEVEELYDVRATLESFAVSEATKHATEEDIRCLDVLQKDGARYAEYGLSEEYDGYHEGIHKAILNLARNDLLSRMMQTISVKIRLCMVFTAALPGRRIEGTKEHADIIEHIRRRDAEGAAELMRRHCETAKYFYLENHLEIEKSRARFLSLAGARRRGETS